MAQVIKVMVSVLVNETYDNGDAITAKEVQNAVETGLQIGLDAIAAGDDTVDAVVDEIITITTDYSI